MKLQIGVKVLIKNAEGRYLLIQRSQPLPDGTGIKWDIPGGRIESEEQLEAALKREIKEEIGIDFDGSLQLLRAQDILLKDMDLHVVRLTYATTITQQITLGDEHQNAQWVTKEEALTLNVDPYLGEVLRNLAGQR